jgi:hypothetical protein
MSTEILSPDEPDPVPPEESESEEDSVIQLPGSLETDPDPLREPVRLELLFPFEFDGTKIDSLTFDFLSIDSKGWKALEKSFRTLYPNDFIPVLMINPAYQELVAARAAKVSPLLIQKLKGPDYLSVTGLVFQFLGNSSARKKLRAKP